MGRHATEWESITQEEYCSTLTEDLHVYSGYHDPAGEDNIDRRPTILTTWGDDEKELIKCFGIRERDFKPHIWDWKYWKAIEWEENE